MKPLTILVYGRDSALLGTRRMVLASAGYSVMEAAHFDEVKRILSAWTVDLLVLCHSLSETDCEEIFNELSARPRLKTLILTSGRSHGETDVWAEVLDARGGPAKLLLKVERLFCRECSDKVATLSSDHGSLDLRTP